MNEKVQLVRGEQLQNIPGAVVAIGNFDGIHLGHQILIAKIKEKAKQLGLSSVVLTFEPHPKEFFSPSKTMPRLMRITEKWLVLEKLGIDYVCCLPFNKNLASQSPEDFVKNILLKKLNAKAIIVGDEFRFGSKRAGDIHTLTMLGEQLGFSVEAVSQFMKDDVRVSSSRVRDALANADFDEVKKLTGRSYCLTGRVAHGEKLGRQLGYPTANIFLHRLHVPLMGIFVVQVHGLSEQPLPAVASLGYRPTFGGTQVLLEVHVFDFDQDIYRKRVTVEFLEKIRDEAKFDDAQSLIIQMNKDAEIARSYFKIN